jgi:2-methylcitrate dehydratase PrpD
MGVTRSLARFTTATAPQAIPAQVLEQAKLRILDTVGVMVGGATHPSTLAARATAQALGGARQVSIIGHRDRAALDLGGFVNGVAAHALECDDYTRLVTHLSAAMVPGTLAMAEHLQASGKLTLECFAVGFQVSSQIARGLGAALFDRGWHSPCMLGAFGVAAAGSRMMGLDEMTTRMAFGIVASEASGIRKNVGSMGKAFHVGHGVRCGLFAVMLASKGFTVDPDALEGVDDGVSGHARFGLAETFNGPGNYDLALMEQGLGSTWELAQNTTVVRMHPGVTALASAIDAMIDLSRKHDIVADQVEAIVLECTAQVAKIGSYKEATDGHKARFCLPYSMAVALLDRKAGVAQYTDERVRKPDVQALMPRVTVVVPEDFRHLHGAWTDKVNWGLMRLSVTLKDGRRFSDARSTAKGWPELPATWEDIAAKYRDCCEGVLPERSVETGIALIGKLEQAQGIDDLINALRPE